MKRATVAIVGRPNVGKSTLFNRILGGRRAIVHDRPGSTRDRHFGRAEWGGRSFWLVDTGGWVARPNDPLSQAIRRQIDLAIAEADLILFVVDTQQGVHPADQEVAELLRTHRDRVLLVANKTDDLPRDTSYHAFHELGLGDPVPVSAAGGKGSGDLLDHVAKRLPTSPEDEETNVVPVAVVGRPNVGKSSLMNRLLGQERAVVAPEPGTTRDAIDSPLRYHDRVLNFIDTAGLRKRSRVADEVEFYSTLRTERAIERADVCVLVVDAADGLHVQDLKIAEAAWEKGAGLIIAVNKWDLISDKESTTAVHGQKEVIGRAPFLEAVPFVYVSALTGLRARKTLDLICEVADARHRRVETADVNQVLRELVDRNQPPQTKGLAVKLLYGSQIGTAPPIFAVVSNHPEAVVEDYQRYLINGFRSAWGFAGTPIRLKLRRRRGKA
ncbi:MAG: ribosome biogenesis GTPase Der [Gemmatimonadetes bacterium]|nr:ribosome biogenesis GTPase Der [Gemmatimonadota bacterium]